MDVLGRDEAGVNGKNLLGDGHVFSHLGWGDDEVEVFLPGAAFEFKKAEAAGDIQGGFKSGGNGETDGFVGAGSVSHGEVSRKRIKATFDAFAGGVERFEVDSDVGWGGHSFITSRGERYVNWGAAEALRWGQLKEGGVPHISTAGPALITYDYTLAI